LKHGKSGTPYCAVNVAVIVGQDDAGKDITQWCRVTAFKEKAEQAAHELTKGSRCYFEGSITLNQWRTSDGDPRADLKVAAWKLLKVGAIGRNKPKRQIDPQSPLERERQPFNDPLDF
jgi:single-strand DNA-binding protein